jgi:capsular polysaccharide biosynthesis protein
MVEPRTLGDALRRYWLLVAIVTVVFAGAGVAAALSRSPVYTSSSSLTVGQLQLSVQSIPGFATGGQSLADTLSRSVTAPQVIDPAAKRLNLAPDYVAANVSASPVVRTSTFVVFGTGGSEREAVDIANAVAASMLTYSRSTQDDPQESRRLLSAYHTAALAEARAERRLSKIKDGTSSSSTSSTSTTSSPSTTSSSSISISEYSRAKAEADELALRSQVAKQAYISNQQAIAAGALIQRLAPARFATNDRSSKVQLYGVLGAIAGALLGAALAVLWAARGARRRRTAAA